MLLPRAVLLGLVLVFGVAACGLLPTRLESPRVTLTGLDLVSVGLFEQRYQVHLRVKNPNASELPIRGMDFRLDINGQVFADGVGQQAINVPAYGEELLTMEVSSSLLQVFRQLQSMDERQSPSFDYRISGNIALGGYGRRLPFDYAGEVSLSDSEHSKGEKGI